MSILSLLAGTGSNCKQLSQEKAMRKKAHCDKYPDRDNRTRHNGYPDQASIKQFILIQLYDSSW